MESGDGRSHAPRPAPRLIGDQSALDRTFAAWARTGVALCALGFIILRLGYYLERLAAAGGVTLPHGHVAVPLGILHIFIGAVVILLAGIWHRRSERALRAGEPDPRALARPVVIGITAASVVGGVGLALDLLLIAPR